MDTKKINLTTRTVLILLVAISFVLTIGVLINNTPIKDSAAVADQWLNPFIYLTAIFIALAGFFTLVFPLKEMVTNPKAGLTALAVIAAFALIFGISYAFATGETDADFYKEFNVDSTWSRLIGASIYMTYIIGALAILTLLGTGIMKFIKK